MNTYSDAPDRCAADRRVLVVGYGSPIRGDDAVGPLVADRLAGRLDDPRVTVVSRHVLTAELVAELPSVSLVIFLDAAMHGTVGSVRVEPVQPDADQAAMMAHSLTAAGLMGLAAALQGSAPPAVLISTPIESLDYSAFELTPSVAEAAKKMEATAIDVVREHLAGGVPSVG